MAAATVAITPGRIAPVLDLAAILVTVAYTATQYTAASGGLPFDLFAALAAAGVNYQDIVGLKPLGKSAQKFIVAGNTFAVGTPTATTLPCTIRIYGTGVAEKGAYTQVDNAALTGSFKALLLVARGGVN